MRSDTDTMTDQQTTARTIDREWVRLQRGVAVGEILVFTGIMLFVRGRFIPPLAMAAGLFAAGALLSLRRPRAGAITVGLVSTLWLGLNIAFASQVIPDLIAVAVTEIFVPTYAMNVLAAVGVIGLVGSAVRARGKLAALIGWVAAGLLLAGIALSLLAPGA